MAKASPPLWRKLEAALIDLLREEGFEIEQSQGESSITLDLGFAKPTTIYIGDFAKELEERL